MRQPQPLATDDVRRALRMLVEVDVPILGVVENLSGSLAPDGAAHRLFGEGGGRMLAEDYGVPFLEHIPVLNFFFTRKGKADEKRRLLILVTPEIIDLAEAEEEQY